MNPVRKICGLTFVETIATLSIAAILVTVAVPTWRNTMEAVHANSARAALLESVGRAISHAALSGTEVVLCPGTSAGCRDTYDWTAGWVAFSDINGNRQPDQGDSLLLKHPELKGQVHLRSTTGRRRLVFQPNGGNAGSNVTFTICDGRGPLHAKTLVLANHGRLRASKPSRQAATACGREL